MNGAAVAELVAKVIAIDGLIDYQPGAVVSRALIKKPNGNVTLFAFDKEQELSEHTAPYDALVYLLEGGVDLTIAGKAFRLAGGQMILMPANQPHSLRAENRSKLLLVMIHS